MTVVEISPGTLIEDTTGSFRGIVECIGVDPSGKPVILLRRFLRTDEAMAKQIYEYYLKLEINIVGNSSYAERRLRKKIASSLNVPEEKALDNYNLIAFSEKDGTLSKFKTTEVSYTDYYICPLEQVTISTTKELKIKNTGSLINIGSSQTFTKGTAVCCFIGFSNPPILLFAKSSSVEIDKIADEIKKVEAYIEKLEEERKSGRISKEAYERLKVEYEERLEKLISELNK
ncbi:MAG: hypothetical protein QW506_07785 [Thermoproteota archaeon]